MCVENIFYRKRSYLKFKMETFFLNKMRRERCELPKAKENDRETNTRIYTGSARPKPTSSPQQSIEIFII